jgi:hypothetical protein
MNIQKIFISGSVQSGKATFGYLLDGHPNILCNIIHDQLINSIKHLQQFCNNDFKKTRENYDKRNEKNIFCKSKKFNKKKEISIYDLREAIFKSNLHHIERLAFLKIYPFYYSRRDYQWLKFNFDYENFEKSWKEQLFNSNEKKDFFLEDIFDSIYKNIFINWKDLENINNKTDFLDKVIVSKLPNDIKSIELVLEENFNTNIIYVERDLIGTLKSRTLNHIISNNLNLNQFDKYFYIMIKSKFLNKLQKEREKIRVLKDKFKDRIFITSLEKVTFDRSNEMKKILKFCNLTYNEIVNRPTYLNESLNSNNLDKINDDEINISEKNYFFVNLLINDKKNLKKIGPKIYLKFYKEYLLSLYLKIRNWWIL